MANKQEITALIGGSATREVPLAGLTKERIKTKFGMAELYRNDTFVFMNRHHPGNKTLPHEINYRANICALYRLGVRRICALFSVGTLRQKYPPGKPVFINDFIDLTSGRAVTRFENRTAGAGHVDMSTPFCPVLTGALHDARPDWGKNAVYACTNGPRLETPAEVKMLRSFGADLVGMTLCPELPLAREYGMSYAGIALPVNWGAGLKDKMDFIADISNIYTDMILASRQVLDMTGDRDCTPAAIH